MIGRRCSRKPKGENEESVERFLGDDDASASLRVTTPIEQIDVSDYDAVFLPGGHGTMWDLPQSEVLAALLAKGWASGSLIGSIMIVFPSGRSRGKNMYLDLEGYYRRQPDPPPPRKPEYRQLSKREQKVLLWILGLNLFLALIAPIGGSTVITGLLSLFHS